jgi:hypothetical protein
VCDIGTLAPDGSFALSSSGNKELPCTSSIGSSGSSLVGPCSGGSGDFAVKIKDIGLCTIAWSHRQVPGPCVSYWRRVVQHLHY